MKKDDRKFRHELKFLIGREKSILIQNRLLGVLKEDRHASNKKYRVTSLYLDDYQLSSYFTKLDGVANRTKYPLRAYNLSVERINFEIKFKNENLINKQSFLLTRDEFNKYINEGSNALADISDADELEKIAGLKDRLGLLKPKIIVDYIRTPLILEEGNVRITIDEDLRYATQSADFFDDENQVYTNVFNKNEVILEIKYDEYLPKIIQALLSEMELYKIAYSKYVLCMQSARAKYQLIRS
ncbi:MAG: polyphosphate polymerase domain-containing protein [Pseudomonadales bacterium]|jgi:hypothetical protein|nr:polyphosphate polymerase domain-containing protein [Pseudomonadales bacterium]